MPHCPPNAQYLPIMLYPIQYPPDPNIQRNEAANKIQQTFKKYKTRTLPKIEPLATDEHLYQDIFRDCLLEVIPELLVDISNEMHIPPSLLKDLKMHKMYYHLLDTEVFDICRTLLAGGFDPMPSDLKQLLDDGLVEMTRDVVLELINEQVSDRIHTRIADELLTDLMRTVWIDEQANAGLDLLLEELDPLVYSCIIEHCKQQKNT
ncbi:hypothetical protein EDD86DRAFT_245060 [Gorgonomyces haynaldii]|nr:hypothetical protein EDD86DRAFT_245060 [Gorgonomyces haynaldii]